MKICLISPPFPFSGKVPMAPPVLEYLGALTLKAMPDAELELIDANVREPAPEGIKADIIGISSMTATITWSYKFSDELRALGKKVILGGIHPTALPDEAKQHADTVVVGEAESVWGDVLNDAKAGDLREFYYGERLPLDKIPLPIPMEGPYKFRAVFTARGCPYRCSFCSVRKFFGDTIRCRPVDKVVEEIEKCAGRIYFNGDDNIWGGDMGRSIELFTKISRASKKWWYGFGDLRAPQLPLGDELLKAAKKSGLFSVWAGWETSSGEGLKMYHASAKQGKDRGWEYYTGASAVFEHPTMSPDEIEERYYRTSLELLSTKRMLMHLFEIPISGFPMTHLLSLMKQIPMKRAMKTAYEKWKKEKG